MSTVSMDKHTYEDLITIGFGLSFLIAYGFLLYFILIP